MLERQSFDWLCEQGHVGLERVAKARRDPALVAPVTTAVEQLEAIYARLNGDTSVLHAARENLLLPVDLVHVPTGTVIEVDGFQLATALDEPTLRTIAERTDGRYVAAADAPALAGVADDDAQPESERGAA